MESKFKSLDLPKKFRIKLLLYNNEPTCTFGVTLLLKLIDELGSLNKACKSCSMSYSNGLRMIRQAEADLGFPLIKGKIGGSGGGGSDLTEQGRLFLEMYTDLSQKLTDFANSYFSD